MDFSTSLSSEVVSAFGVAIFWEFFLKGGRKVGFRWTSREKGVSEIKSKLADQLGLRRKKYHVTVRNQNQIGRFYPLTCSLIRVTENSIFGISCVWFAAEFEYCCWSYFSEIEYCCWNYFAEIE